jgi:hypothetical protein
MGKNVKLLGLKIRISEGLFKEPGMIKKWRTEGR